MGTTKLRGQRAQSARRSHSGSPGRVLRGERDRGSGQAGPRVCIDSGGLHRRRTRARLRRSCRPSPRSACEAVSLGLARRSPSTVRVPYLGLLQKQGCITRAQLDAWKKVRDQVAHHGARARSMNNSSPWWNSSTSSLRYASGSATRRRDDPGAGLLRPVTRATQVIAEPAARPWRWQNSACPRCAGPGCCAARRAAGQVPASRP